MANQKEAQTKEAQTISPEDETQTSKHAMFRRLTTSDYTSMIFNDTMRCSISSAPVCTAVRSGSSQVLTDSAFRLGTKGSPPEKNIDQLKKHVQFIPAQP